MAFEMLFSRFLVARFFVSGVLNKDKNCALISTLDAWGILSI